MATINELAPVSPAPFPPRLRLEAGSVILSVVTSDGRIHRLALSHEHFATLAGDVVSAVAGALQIGGENGSFRAAGICNPD